MGYLDPPDNTGKTYKKRRKEKGLVITETRLRKAIPGSQGRISRIARRLGVTGTAVSQALKKPKFQFAKALILDEQNKLCDMAEDAIVECIKQNKDLSTKSRTSFRFLESRRSTKWEKKTTVALEGGSAPIQIQHSQQLVNVEDLPLQLRREILNQLLSNHKEIEESQFKQIPLRKIKVRKRAQ